MICRRIGMIPASEVTSQARIIERLDKLESGVDLRQS
jgi:hypothetical protein